MNFKDKVYGVVKKIPKGKVLTYKEVAKKAGRPLAFRAVGNILNKNIDKSVPCHRVIRSDGKIGGYNGLQGQKRMLLVKEGYLK
jgi:O-6-methylguanine DNA methyltransferase